jgi:aspartyl-tRNA(Asn)/glutamyl-tRNA(Gln) amidotransferase subunit A
VQPSLSVRGWPTEAGSVALEGFVALDDATVVERLRAAGAAIVASSRMAELGFGLAGDTTAAVLAERHGDVALVADTMGEARHVAAAAGAVGLKPSYGIVSRFGLIGLVPSMECIGVVARSAEDAACVMAALAGPDEWDPSMRDAQPPDFAKVGEGQDGVASVGVVRELLDAMEPGEADDFRKSLSKLEDAGIRCEQVSLRDFGLLRTVHNVVGSVEASSAAG